MNFDNPAQTAPGQPPKLMEIQSRMESAISRLQELGKKLSVASDGFIGPDGPRASNVDRSKVVNSTGLVSTLANTVHTLQETVDDVEQQAARLITGL